MSYGEWRQPGMWVGGSGRTNTEHHDSVCYKREGVVI